MCRKSELEPLRQNLRNNLWRVIEREPIKIFPFMEYLVDILVNRYKKITVTSTKIFKAYRDKLKDIYAQILDYIEGKASSGDIISLEQYIKNKINGNITNILDEFVENYEKSKKNN